MKFSAMKTIFTVFLISILSVTNTYALSIDCPPDQYVSCTDEVWDLSNYPNATYTDYNGTHDAGTPVVEYFLNMCDVGTINRTWTVSAYGHTVTCTQTFYVQGVSFGYSNINWPLSGLELEGCNPNTDPEVLPAGYGAPTFDNMPCTMIGVNYNDEIFIISPTCKKLLRNWQVMDWCTYDYNTGYGLWTFTQVIKIIDGEIPDAVAPEDITAYSDNCKDAFVQIPLVQVDPISCGGEYKVTHHSIYADSLTGPDASGVYPLGTTKIKFAVHYACGKKSYHYVDIIVKDNKNPVPYCLAGLSIPLMGIDTDDDGVNDEGMVEIWASDLDHGSYHTCPSHYPLHLSFSNDIKDKAKTFTCEEIGDNNVELWVTDRYGNQDFCIVILSIQNNGANITDCEPEVLLTEVSAEGFIHSVLGESIMETEVYLEAIQEELNEEEEEAEQESYSSNLMTDRYGHFKFENLPLNKNYKVSCSKEIDLHDYVTNEDVRALYLHITRREIITNPYLLIAADLDDNQIIDRADLYAMYYFTHGQNETLGIEKTHIFMNDDIELTDVATYYNNEFDSYKMIEDMDNNISDLGFSMIVKGDIYSPTLNPYLRNSFVTDQEIKKYLENDGSISNVVVQPNPFDQRIQLDLGTIPATDIIFNLMDTNGKILLKQTYNTSNKISIELDSKINAGIYYYKVIFDDHSHIGKIIKI